MLSVGVLIVQVSSVSCKTVCRWIKTNDIPMTEEVTVGFYCIYEYNAAVAVAGSLTHDHQTRSCRLTIGWRSPQPNDRSRQ